MCLHAPLGRIHIVFLLLGTAGILRWEIVGAPREFWVVPGALWSITNSSHFCKMWVEPPVLLLQCRNHFCHKTRAGSPDKDSSNIYFIYRSPGSFLYYKNKPVLAVKGKKSDPWWNATNIPKWFGLPGQHPWVGCCCIYIFILWISVLELWRKII